MKGADSIDEDIPHPVLFSPIDQDILELLSPRKAEIAPSVIVPESVSAPQAMEDEDSLLVSMTPILNRPLIAAQYSHPNTPQLEHTTVEPLAVDIPTSIQRRESGLITNYKSADPPALPPPPSTIPPEEPQEAEEIVIERGGEESNIEQLGPPLGYLQLELIIRKHGRRGIGITLIGSSGSTEGFPQIKRVLPNSVGARCGLHLGDRLVSIDGNSLEGLTVNDITNIICEAPKEFSVMIWRNPSHDLETSSSIYSHESRTSVFSSTSDDNTSDIHHSDSSVQPTPDMHRPHPATNDMVSPANTVDSMVSPTPPHDDTVSCIPPVSDAVFPLLPSLPPPPPPADDMISSLPPHDDMVSPLPPRDDAVSCIPPVSDTIFPPLPSHPPPPPADDMISSLPPHDDMVSSLPPCDDAVSCIPPISDTIFPPLPSHPPPATMPSNDVISSLPPHNDVSLHDKPSVSNTPLPNHPPPPDDMIPDMIPPSADTASPLLPPPIVPPPTIKIASSTPPGSPRRPLPYSPKHTPIRPLPYQPPHSPPPQAEVSPNSSTVSSAPAR